MALGFYFHAAPITTEQYDEAILRLKAAGAGKPEGRLFHCCFGESGELSVFDVWDTQADFDKFGDALKPILGEMGIDQGKPNVVPVHNFTFG